MSASLLGRRYAKALYALAGESQAVEQVSRDLSDFAATWKSSPELRAVFENPGFSAEVRRRVLRDIAAQGSLHEQVRNTLLLLADRRRLSFLPEIVDALDEIVAAKSGRLSAEVTTASQLPETYFTALQRTLREVTGKEVDVVHKTDPSLIGGVVTRIGDQVFDGSIRNRLSELKDELLRE